MAPKRKRSSVAEASPAGSNTLDNAAAAAAAAAAIPLPAKSRSRKAVKVEAPDSAPILSNGLHPVASTPPAPEIIVKVETAPESPLSDAPEVEMPPPKAKGKGKGKNKDIAAKEDPPTMPAKSSEDVDALRDPEADVDEEVDEEEVMEALSRPPPVNSSYLPLPWKGRLGYACLNTYLRYSNPPVFSSRTCRIASILEHRHPLADPSQPEHATKNRPDRSQPADVARGKRYVEDICLANVRDIAKMIRWNDRYGIKFLRLSSEMFPFASHEEYGYKLADFAAHDLEEAGKVVAHYGHRVTTHPGQFTQLGSPRKQVTDNAVRDLAYHDELLSLLKLPEQLNRDAVMILHMGGVFGDKAATLDRFREIYATLSPSIKNRLVLENDDVSYSVHELLPICEELNIPMVLDFHHHNIIFDDTRIREGTEDIVGLYPRILATWRRKGITPKMHYSEPCPGAITGRQRRKHRPRVATLPPCPDDMDLMIEAKDKEQAVFELMKTFKLPGHDTFNEMVPYARADDNKFALQEMDKRKRQLAAKKAKAAKKGETLSDDDDDEADVKSALISDQDVGMGGPDGRVYWPPGMEEWLRPKKREVKPKGPGAPAAKKAVVAVDDGAKCESEDSDPAATPATKKAKSLLRQRARAKAAAAGVETPALKAETAPVVVEKGKGKRAPAKKGGRKKKVVEAESVMTPETSSVDGASDFDVEVEDDVVAMAKRGAPAAAKGRRQSGRARKGVSYAAAQEDEEMDVD